MVIGEINSGASPVINNNDTTQVRAEQPAAGRATAGRTIDWTSTTAQVKNRFELAQLQTVNDRVNGIASGVSQDSRQLTEAGRVLNQMKAQLYQIVKMYPPYPVGDSDRIRFLRTFSGLRQEIDHLTIPPTDKWDGTARESASGSTQSSAMNAQAAPARFAIPQLSLTANDQEVRAAWKQTGDAIAEIAARQKQLADNAEQARTVRGQQEKIAVIEQASGGRWDIAVPGERKAEQLSGEVRQAIAGSEAANIFGAQPQLAALAG